MSELSDTIEAVQQALLDKDPALAYKQALRASELCKRQDMPQCCMTREEVVAKFRDLMEIYLGPVIPDVLDTLSWMVEDMNYRRQDTGLEEDPLYPKMQVAIALLEDLRAGRIECRRRP